MEIDHIFMLVEPGDPDLKYLYPLGLVETYRRTHPGQGTQNICFCFENVFLECLLVCDINEVRSEAIARICLYERSQWRITGANPFGIAWRTTREGEDVGSAIRTFRPPYLPNGVSIDVSVDSDDLRQPMMFRSPGATHPAKWPAERRRDLQKPAGLGRILAINLTLPCGVVPSPALTALAQATILNVQSSPDDMPSLTCEIERLNHDTPLVIGLPA